MPRKGTFLVRVVEVEKLRAAAAMTLEQLAHEAGISARNLSRILNGEPAFIGTIAAIAEALNVKCEALLQLDEQPAAVFDHEHTDGDATLTLHIEVTGPPNSAKVLGVIALLRKLLPDSTDICVIGGAGTAIIAVSNTRANAAALGSEPVRIRLKALGVNKWERQCLTSVPEHITVLGNETFPLREYGETRFINTKAGDIAEWKRKSLLEQLHLILVALQRERDHYEIQKPLNWGRIRSGNRLDPAKATAKGLHSFAEIELNLSQSSSPDNDPRRVELKALQIYAQMLDVRDQVEALLRQARQDAT